MITGESEKGGWLFAFMGSLMLHGAVLAAFLCCRACDGSKPQSGEPDPVATSSSTPVAELPPVMPERVGDNPFVDEPVSASGGVTSSPGPSRPAAANPQPPARDPGPGDVYVVKKGDTLTAIAKRCGMTLAELAKLNGSSVQKLSNLKIGQKLKVKTAE